MRKALSLCLAMCMVFALCVSPAAASGEPSGSSGESAAADETPVLPETVMLDELILSEGDIYVFTGDTHVGHLEIAPGAEVSSEYPVIVTFESSDSVENGAIVNNVQFVSDYDEVIAVVHTNDVHGHIDVEPYVKGLADAMKASGEYSLVLTVSAGDVYGGGEAVAGAYNGEFIPAIMDPVYDVIVPGNNDYGANAVIRHNLLLSSLYEHSQTLCANIETYEGGLTLTEYVETYEPFVGAELFDALYEKVTSSADGSIDLSGLELFDLPGGVDPYPATTTFVTEQGTVVGVFGLTTVGGVLTTEVQALGSVSQARECVDELRAHGADVVICVGHTGWMGEGASGASSNDTNSWQLANAVTGLDVFVDGHTHSVINRGQGVLVGGTPTFVNQAQCFGYCIGVMYLYVKDGRVIARTGDVLTDMSGIDPDPDVQALVDLTLARAEEDLGTPIAYTPHFLNGERLSAGNEGGSVRGNETNLGDLMTDILLAACSEKMGVEYDFAAYPGFHLRASIEAGDITPEDIRSVFGHPTILYYDTYTAADVLSMVTAGLQSVYPEAESTGFMHYSGIRVTYTDNGGRGTPVTIVVGDTLIYDASAGGVLVSDNWTCTGITTLAGDEADNYTGDMANWIVHDQSELHALVENWFRSHGPEDYTVYPNTVAPDGRLVEVSDMSEAGKML